ncbi:MAG: O-antigen ligase family protein, partial [Pseudanabaena sp. LacPavin_0818_WC45_MAG_42_6]|nr:O-antigen ligase family protein [Pseudanabaena sp. LacPavin_0818_WC45_MAG_42_6]
LKLAKIKENPAAVASLILLGLYCLGTLYASAVLPEKMVYLGKYSKLLLIPLIIGLVDSDAMRRYCIQAFLLGIFLLLFISYGKWLHLLPMSLGLHDFGIDHGYIAFKNRIAHSVLVSFGMYIMLLKAFQKAKTIHYGWLISSFLAFFNILYLVNGRTGQVIALVLVIFFIARKFSRKAALCAVIFLVSIVYFKNDFSFLLPERMIATSQELKEHQSDKNLTSAGIRMEMYKNMSALILESPWVGYGTGSIKETYKKYVATQNTLLTEVSNPHNQYLFTLFDLGLLGFFVLLYFFYQCWSVSQKSKKIDGILAVDYMEGLLLVMMIGCLFNSLLLDATEGKFFCFMTGIILSSYFPRKLIKKS